MLDLSHIPNSQQDIQIFYANQGNFGYQTWRKPKKCNFVYILSIDGGGGGSSGISTSLNTGVAGNCGGGSGAVGRVLVNSNFVPDTLYVKVGKGGTGGLNQTGGGFVTANSGSVGEASGVFCIPTQSSQNNNNQNSSFIGGNTSAQGGTTAASVNGSAVSALGNNHLTGLTNFISTIGRPSAGGLSGGTPSNIAPLTSHILTAGCAGAPYNGVATPFDGGGINASSISPLIAGGVGGGLVGGNGADGYTSWKPFFSTGGAGGGNAYTSGGVAGDGGNGGIGSGGGAGGNANFGTSGKGGNGGDGIVIIISF
jgi:hypothetical protein